MLDQRHIFLLCQWIWAICLQINLQTNYALGFYSGFSHEKAPETNRKLFILFYFSDKECNYLKSTLMQI